MSGMGLGMYGCNQNGQRQGFESGNTEIAPTPPHPTQTLADAQMLHAPMKSFCPPPFTLASYLP